MKAGVTWFGATLNLFAVEPMASILTHPDILLVRLSVLGVTWRLGFLFPNVVVLRLPGNAKLGPFHAAEGVA